MLHRKKYRLRRGKVIVGYATEHENGLFIKGSEWFWFMRRNLSYDRIDEYVGIKDNLNREVYELDIVEYKLEIGVEARKGVALWEQSSKEFVLYDIKDDITIPIFTQGLNIFAQEPVHIISHLFNNPDLMKKLGII